MRALLLGGLPLLARASPPNMGPPSCSSWAAGSCLSWKDGKLAMFTNLSSPASCCAQCGADARCRAWSLYGGGGKELPHALYYDDLMTKPSLINSLSSWWRHRFFDKQIERLGIPTVHSTVCVQLYSVTDSKRQYMYT